MRRWFARRWHGEVGAAHLWWRDMLAIGTVVNLAVSGAALMAYAQGAGVAWALAIHLATLPFNAFMWLCLWRRAERTPLQLVLASVWFAAMFLV